MIAAPEITYGRRNSRDYVEQLVTRAAVVAPESLNEEGRTVQATLSTDQPVAIYDFRSGRIIDEILVAEGGIYPRQMPLFDEHFASTMRQLGSIRNIQVGKSESTGTLHFARDAGKLIDDRWQMVRQKHITDVSIGYTYIGDDYVEIAPGRTEKVNGKSYTAGARILRVVSRWRCREGSITAIGADDQAKIRSQNGADNRNHNCDRSNSDRDDSQSNANGTDSDGTMRKALRQYLESIGLRNEATEKQAWTFYRMLGGDQNTRAAEIAQKNQDAVPGDDDGDDDDAAGARSTATTPPTVPPATAATSPSDADPEQVRRAERERIAHARGYENEVSEELIQRAIDDGWSQDEMERQFLREIRQNLRSEVAAPGHRLARRNADEQSESRTLQMAMLMRYGFEPDAEMLRSSEASMLLRGRDSSAGWVVDASRSINSNGRAADDVSRIIDEAYGLRHMTLMDFCRRFLESSGQRVTSLEPEEIIQRSMSSASVQAIFTTAFNAQMIQGFLAYLDTTSQWTRETELPNFQPAERIQMGKFTHLKRRVRGQVPEHGSIDADFEHLQVFEYAEKFVLDEQDIVDDRFGALNQLSPQEMGEAAMQLRPDLVYGYLLSNPDLRSGTALFHADHGNLAVGAFGGDTLSSAKVAFNTRTLANSDRLVGVRAGFLLVPEELEDAAIQELGSVELRNNEADLRYGIKNPNYNRFKIVPEARIGSGVKYPLTDTGVTGEPGSWFLADAMARYGIEVAFLRGRGRQPRSRRLRNVLDGYAIGWTVDHAIGVGAVGFEGLMKRTAS